MLQQDEEMIGLSKLVRSLDESFKSLKSQLEERIGLEDAFVLFMKTVDDIVQLEEIVVDFSDTKNSSQYLEFNISYDKLTSVINDIVVSYQEGDLVEFKRLFCDIFETEYERFKQNIENQFMQPELV